MNIAYGRQPKRETEFAAIGHTTRNACEATRPPEALATPSPLLDSPKKNAKIKVSFIIGTDGRVHSPFILESAGSFGRSGCAGCSPHLALSSGNLQRSTDRGGSPDWFFGTLVNIE